MRTVTRIAATGVAAATLAVGAGAGVAAAQQGEGDASATIILTSDPSGCIRLVLFGITILPGC